MHGQNRRSLYVPILIVLVAFAFLNLVWHSAGSVSGQSSFTDYTLSTGSEPGSSIAFDADATPLNLGDDSAVALVLPFNFAFYGTIYDRLVIANNGAVTFGGGSGWFPYYNQELSTTNQDLLIAPFWDDIDSDTGNVYYKTTGTSPNRRFIVEWYNRPHYPNSGAVTFQLILYEGSNNIKFHYFDVYFDASSYPEWDRGGSATVGLRKNSSQYLQYSYNTQSLENEFVLCFRYPGSPACGDPVTPTPTSLPATSTPTPAPTPIADENGDHLFAVSQSCRLVRVTPNFENAAIEPINNEPVINSDGSVVAFWSTMSGNLAFDENIELDATNEDGSIELFRAENASSGYGTVAERTTSNGSILGGFNLSASITDDGDRIAFFSDHNYNEANPDGTFEVYLLDESTNTLVLTRVVTDADRRVNILPSISGDGSRLSFVSDGEIFVVDRSTNDLVQVTDATGTIVGKPVISGDGMHVGFATDKAIAGNNDASTDVFRATVANDGTVSFTQITDGDTNVTHFQPTINEDGSRIAYMREENGQSVVVLADVDTADRITLTANITDTLEYSRPAIDAEGGRVAFVGSDGVSQTVYLYDTEIGLLEVVEPQRSADVVGSMSQPDISADGANIVFVAGGDILLLACRYSDAKITKAAPIAVAGSPITYTLTIENLGPSEATGLRVTDTLPLDVVSPTVSSSDPVTCSFSGNEVDCSFADPLAGTATRHITVTGDLAPSLPAGHTLTNTAAVTVTSFDRTTDNNVTTITNTVVRQSDMAVAKTAPATVTAGRALTYTLTFTNVAGPSVADGVVVTDVLPVGVTYGAVIDSDPPAVGDPLQSGRQLRWDLGAFVPDDTGRIVFTTTVGADGTGPITNTARVGSDSNDLFTTNNTVTRTTAVETKADLAVTKLAAPDPVAQTETITYTITFTNTDGPSVAREVRITDTLPNGVEYGGAVSQSPIALTGPTPAGQTLTWELPQLAPGASGQIIFTGTVTATTGSTITNTVAIDSSTTDTDSSNNQRSIVTDVVPKADLYVIKRDDPDPVVAGARLTYTLTVVNDGPSQATSVVLTDTLPTGLQIDSLSSGCFGVVGGSDVVCTTGSLDANDAITFTIGTFVDSVGVGGTITNTATASATELDDVVANSTVTETTLVYPIIEIGGVAVSENEPEAVFQVTLSGLSDRVVTVDYETRDGTAISGGAAADEDDYDAVSGTLTFDGTQTEAITVTINDDDVNEADTETFTVELSNPVNAALGVVTATGTITDDEDAGVTVTPTTLDLNEGASGPYTITLTSRPQNPVTIYITPTEQVTVSATSVTLNASNWDSGQVITVQANDDDIDENSPHTGTIDHGTQSNDGDYDGLSVDSVTVNITDDDTAGMDVDPTNLTVAEPDGTNTFTIRLTSEPSEPVTVTLSSSDTTACLVSDSSVTLDSSTWESGAEITVTAQDDDVDDGDQTCTVLTSAADSDDPNYDGKSVDDVTVTVKDDDTADILSTSDIVAAKGSTETYTVTLASEPTSKVIVDITSSDRITVTPTQLTFTSTDWNTAQTVTVTVGADGTITQTASSGDGNYDGIETVVTVQLDTGMMLLPDRYPIAVVYAPVEAAPDLRRRLSAYVRLYPWLRY